MLHVILYQPEIPPNTGNVIRLCANAGACLHLVGPLGFQLSDPKLKRAGLDYRELSDIRLHVNWKAFRDTSAIERVWAFTTRAPKNYSSARFQDGDGLLFGPETRGLPTELLEETEISRNLRIPMQADNRSLNLSNSVAIALYEAWRQLGFKTDQGLRAC